jgi:predicted O-methyltransferase YrrM
MCQPRTPRAMTPDSHAFSQDWFSENIPTLAALLRRFVGKNDVKALEIGCFEGMSTCWFLDNILTGENSTITVIDTFGGGYDHHEKQIDFTDTEADFRRNTARHADRISVVKGVSQWKLRELRETFDLVYVDGSHTSSDVLEDAVLSFRLLKSGGLMILDDYEWDAYADQHLNPRMGIDCFLRAYAGQFRLLNKSYQVAIEKV